MDPIQGQLERWVDDGPAARGHTLDAISREWRPIIGRFRPGAGPDELDDLLQGALEWLVLAPTERGPRAMAPDDADSPWGWRRAVLRRWLVDEARGRRRTSPVREAVDLVLGAEHDDDSPELLERLTALVDACSAASARLEDVEDAICIIRAFPELWRSVADAANTNLRASLPEPARALWTAVQASAWTSDAPDLQGEAPPDVKLRVGAPVFVPLTDAGPARRIGRGPDWTLTLTGSTLRLIGAPATFECDRAVVQPTRSAAAVSCPATPGAWRVAVDGRVLAFVITEDPRA